MPVFAFVAVGVCRRLNELIDRGDARALAFNTFPVAVFAMTTLLPLLVLVDSAAIGLLSAIEQFTGGQVGRGLLLLFLGIPVVTFVNYLISSLIAAGIDRIVLILVPGAPMDIFPPTLSRKEAIAAGIET